MTCLQVKLLLRLCIFRHRAAAALISQERFLLVDVWKHLVWERNQLTRVVVVFAVYELKCSDLFNSSRAPQERSLHVCVENILCNGRGTIQSLSRLRSSALGLMLGPVRLLTFWPAVPGA